MTLPKTSDGFEWTQEAWGPALRCTALPVAHLFTTRTLQLRGTSDQPAGGWSQLEATFGVDPGHVLRPKQVHGDEVFIVTSDQASLDDVCGSAADAIMTINLGVAVAVQAADCVPILFMDLRTGAVAAAHAGWRGTAARMAGKVVGQMGARFGTRPQDLVAAIGPSIGPCCYQVGEELLGAFGPDGRRWFYRVANSLMLNLWLANRDQLLDAGVRPANVHVAEFCTVMHPDLFDSFRRDGQRAGRQAAVIRAAAGAQP